MGTWGCPGRVPPPAPRLPLPEMQPHGARSKVPCATALPVPDPVGLAMAAAAGTGGFAAQVGAAACVQGKRCRSLHG